MYWLALLALPSVTLALRPGASASRRVLACALAVLVPIAGPLLAVLVRRVRGGAIALEPIPERPIRRLSAGDVARLGEMPPALDRLLAGDPGERLEALVGLSSAGDALAVEILRWTIEHGPSEAVLDAALTLEEIELRGESHRMAARDALDQHDDVARILAAADAAAAPVLNRIADPTVALGLAAQARDWYRLALALAPERIDEIEEKSARLELAAGRPVAALELVAGMLGRTGEPTDQLRALGDDAAFAARAFDRLSFTPVPLDVPRPIAVCRP